MSEDKKIGIKQIVIWICEPCLKGEGQECHTPGCALFLHRVDLPIHPEMYVEIGWMQSDGTASDQKAEG